MSEKNENSNDSNTCDEAEAEVQCASGTATAAQVNQNLPKPVLNNPLIRAGVLRPSVLNSSRNAFDSSNRSRLGDADDVKSTNCTSITHHANEQRQANEVQVNPFLLSHKNEEINDNADNADEEKVANAETTEKSMLAKDSDPDADENTIAKQEKLSLNCEQQTLNAGAALFRKNGLDGVNLFAAAAKTAVPMGKGCDFVFGENVHERVVGDNIKVDSSTQNLLNIPNSSTMSSSELLFSSVAKNVNKSMGIGEGDETNSTKAMGTTETTTAKTLSDVAREYEEKRAQKRKFEEMKTFTGEEDEINIIDICCKLFAFVNSNWEERGRGSLRLNDSNDPECCSRLVFRTFGNLRLLLNTKVWAGMVAEQPSQKSMRLTAIDKTGKIKVFLVMARPREISELYQKLSERITQRAITHPHELSAVNECSDVEEKKDQDEYQAEESAAAVKTPMIQPDLINSAKAMDVMDATQSTPEKMLKQTVTAEEMEAISEAAN